MKKVFLFIAVIVFGSLLISSCSTPADSWSCSKLKSEIKECEKNIYASRYNYENGAMTHERYTENVKAFENAIEQYRERLSTCKEESIQSSYKKPPSNTQVNKKNEETLSAVNDLQVEGSWSSSAGRELGFVRTTFTKLENNKYKATSKLIDGSESVENLTLSKGGEYHTHNKFGEYYKFTGSALGSYDRDGIIYLLYKE